MKNGGITRFKFHLAGNDPRKNSKQCPNVSLEGRKEIVQLLRKKEIEKKKKEAMFEDIREELRGGLGVPQSNDSDDDLYMYPTDMHPDERDEYRAAVRASKQSEWEREQQLK